MTSCGLGQKEEAEKTTTSLLGRWQTETTLRLKRISFKNRRGLLVTNPSHQSLPSSGGQDVYVCEVVRERWKRGEICEPPRGYSATPRDWGDVDQETGIPGEKDRARAHDGKEKRDKEQKRWETLGSCLTLPERKKEVTSMPVSWSSQVRLILWLLLLCISLVSQTLIKGTFWEISEQLHW